MPGKIQHARMVPFCWNVLHGILIVLNNWGLNDVLGKFLTNNIWKIPKHSFGGKANLIKKLALS